MWFIEMNLGQHIVYYHYFAEAIFDKPFAKWRNWEFYGVQCGKTDAESKVCKRNLKLFLPLEYDEKKYSILLNLLTCLDFEFVCQQLFSDHKRIIFWYGGSYGGSYYMKTLLLNELMEKAVMESEKKQRSNMSPTVEPNRYENAAYFLRMVRCKDPSTEQVFNEEWKYPCKRYKDAFYWRRYFAIRRGEDVTVVKTSFSFQENEIELGGKWIDESTGMNVDMFYPPPDEKFEGDVSKLRMSEWHDNFSLKPERAMEMVRFYSETEKKFTGRCWVELSTCILTRGEELQTLLEKHVIRSYGPYVGRLFIE